MAASNFKATSFTEAVMQISTFLVLVGIFVLIFGEYKFSLYISTVLWVRKYDVFYFPFDHTIEVSRDFLGGAPSS